MKATYYWPLKRGADTLIPVRHIATFDLNVRVIVTATRNGFDKGTLLDIPKSEFVEKCGKQRGQWIGNLFGGKAVFVRPVH